MADQPDFAPEELTLSESSQSSTSSVADGPLLTEWTGLSALDSATIPADPHGAAGPNGILQVVNLNVTYFQKNSANGQGVRVWPQSHFSSFFNLSAPIGHIADPKAIFDPVSQRFFIVLQQNTHKVDPSTGGITLHSYVNIAVSRSSHPQSSGAADWIVYRREISDIVNSSTATFPSGVYGGDYPGIGFDADALYVTYNMYRLRHNPQIDRVEFSPTVPVRNVQILVLPKAQLIGETLPEILDRILTNANPEIGQPTSFTLQPVTIVGPERPTGVAYFIEADMNSTTSLRVWALKNPTSPSTRVLSSASVAVPPHGGAATLPLGGSPRSIAPQPPENVNGSTSNYYLDNRAGYRMMGEAFWYRGHLWCCHSAGGSTTRAIVYYYDISTNGYTGPGSSLPVRFSSGTVDEGPGQWAIYPAISCTNVGEIALVYTLTSSSTYATIRCVRRPHGAATFDQPITLRASQSIYTTANSPDSVSRWGDYAVVAADPLDGSLWMSAQYAMARTTNLLTNQWGTSWSNVRPYLDFVSFTNTAQSAADGPQIALDGVGHQYLLAQTKGSVYVNRDILVFKTDLDGSPSATWADIGNGVGVRRYDSGYLTDTPSAIVADSNQNVYIVGKGASAGMCVLKYNAAGNLLWSRSFLPNSGSYGGWGNDVKVDSSGNVYVCGEGYFTNDNTNGGIDAYVWKFTANGDPSTTWPNLGDGVGVRRYNHSTSSLNAGFDRCVLDQAGNLYVAGYGATGSFGQCRFLIAKYSPTGTRVWERGYSPGTYERAVDIALNPTASAVFVTGTSEGVGQDIVTLRCAASTGATVWAKRVTGANASRIKVGPYNEVYVGGSRDNALAVIRHEFATGAVQWSNTFAQDSIGYSYLNDMVLDGAGDVYAAGVGSSSGWNNGVVQRFGSDGTLKFQAIYDTIVSDWFTSIAIDGSSNIYLGGVGGNFQDSLQGPVLVKYNGR